MQKWLGAALAVGVLAGPDPSGLAVSSSPGVGPASEWREWGGTPGGVRFSRLRQVDRGNVAQLAPAWTYRTGELTLGLAHLDSQAPNLLLLGG